MFSKKVQNFDKYEGGIRSIKNRSNRYEELDQIGAGGMGVVYVAKDLTTNEPVAIKKSSYQTTKEVDLRERDFLQRLCLPVKYKRRASVIYKTTGDIGASEYEYSNYIIEFKEAILVEKYHRDNLNPASLLFSKSPDAIELWLIQEYCEAGDLYHLMRSFGRGFTITEISHIVANVVLGLKHIHQRKIVHRDIKALNILLTYGGKVKICDFGRAEKLDLKKKHDLNNSRVTDLWMAPEMYQDSSCYGCEVDIWALGITMIELFRQNPPFSDQNGSLVFGNIMNLSDMSNVEQRRVLNIPPPPKELTLQSKGKNNNYHMYYDEVGYYMRKQGWEYVSNEPEESSNIGVDNPYDTDEEDPVEVLNEFSSLRMSMDGFSELPGVTQSSTTPNESSPDEKVKDEKSDAEDSKPKPRGTQLKSTKSEAFFEVDMNDISDVSYSKAKDNSKRDSQINGTNAEEKRDSDSDATFVDLDDSKKQTKQSGDTMVDNMKNFLIKTIKKDKKGKKKSNDNDNSNLVQKREVVINDVKGNDGYEGDIDYTMDRKSRLSKLAAGWLSPSKNTAKKGGNTKNTLQRHKTGFNLLRSATAGNIFGLTVNDNDNETNEKATKLKPAKQVTISRQDDKKVPKLDTAKATKRRSALGLAFSTSAAKKERSSVKRKLKQQKAEKDARKKAEWQKRHSYIQLSKYDEETIFFEFVAWCLSVDQRQRPTAFELCEHPFIHKQVKHLVKSERTDCCIKEHSDFLMRADVFDNVELFKEDLEEEESDDDKFLDHAREPSLYNKYGVKSLGKKPCNTEEAERDVCTCSATQTFLRSGICAEAKKKQGGKRWKRAFEKRG